MTILLFCVALFVLLALRPVGFADSATLSAGPSAEPGAEDDNRDAPTEEAPETDDPLSMVRQSAQELGIALDEESPRKPDVPNKAEGPQPLSPADEVLQAFELDGSKIPPEYRGVVAETVQKWFNEKYAPVAQRVGEYARQLEAREQINKNLEASAEYDLAAQLVQNPQLYEHVQAFLSGQVPAGQNAPAQLPNVNWEALTDNEKLIYQHAYAAQDAAQRLEQHNQGLLSQIGQLQQYVQQLGGHVQTQWQQQQQQEAQALQAQAGQRWNESIAKLQNELGFDPRLYKKEMDAAVDYIVDTLSAMNTRARQEGTRIDPQQVDYDRLLRNGFKLAGLFDVAEKRKRQAAATPRPPGGRANGRALPGDDPRELIRQSAQELGIEL